MTNHLHKTLEGIVSLFKTGTKTYPASNRVPDVVLDELEEYIMASTAHPGISELATTVEAQAGVSASLVPTVSGVKQMIAGGLRFITFSGVGAAGPCTAVGLVVGDVVLAVQGIAGVFGDAAADFEAAVTVDDQIQQADAGNLSANKYLAILYRSVA